MHRLLRSGKSWSGHETNCAFLNLADGSFADISELSGMHFADDARGLCPIDWDGDGDLDIWLRNRTGPQLRYMHNTYDGPNRAVAIELVGKTCNRDAVGARVTAHLGDRRILRTVSADANFQTQASKTVHFGIDRAARIDRLEVRWPDGSESAFDALAPGRYRIVQSADRAVALAPRPPVRLKPTTLPTQHAPATSDVPLAFRVPLPDLGGADLDGGRLSISAHKGRPLLVNLWASWCPGCLEELSAFHQHRAMLESAGVGIVALSLDEPGDHAAARRIAEKIGPWFEVGFADPQWVAVLEVVQRIVIDVQDQMNLPASILLDKNGHIARLYNGPVEPATLAEHVAALAETDEAIVRQATPYAQGIGHVVIPHSKAIRLLQLSEALITNGHPLLAEHFAGLLVEQMASYPTLASTQKRAGRVFVELARILEPSEPRRAAQCARRGDEFFALACRRYAEDLAADPNDRNAWFSFGEMLTAITNDELADQLVAEALAKIPEPRSPSDLRERGKDLFNLGRWSEAIPYLEQTLRASPDDANTQYRLGTALLRAGRADEGVGHVERALAVLPPHPVAEFNFAQDLRAAGMRDAAIEHYKRTLTLDPTYDPAREALRELGTELAGGD